MHAYIEVNVCSWESEIPYLFLFVFVFLSSGRGGWIVHKVCCGSCGEALGFEGDVIVSFHT